MPEQEQQQKKQAPQSVNKEDQATAQKKQANKTGIPDNMKASIEYMSGFSLAKVKVHYNSEKPALYNAHAYTEGYEVYLAPGQEKHLAHELWHIVQKMKGEVKADSELQDGTKGNNDKGLEKEATKKGDQAKGMAPKETPTDLQEATPAPIMQRMLINIDADSTIEEASASIEKNKGSQNMGDVHKLEKDALAALKETETLHIVAHGYHSLTDPSTEQPNLLPMLKGGISPAGLYDILESKGWPKEHKGKIDLRACMTGAESALPNFAELFGAVLAKNGRNNKIVGYKHLSKTDGKGEEEATSSTASKMVKIALQADTEDKDFAKQVTDLFETMNGELAARRTQMDNFVKSYPLMAVSSKPDSISEDEWRVYSFYHSIKTGNAELRAAIVDSLKKDQAQRDKTIKDKHDVEITPSTVSFSEEQTKLLDSFVEYEDIDDDFAALLERMEKLKDTTTEDDTTEDSGQQMLSAANDETAELEERLKKLLGDG